MKQIIITINDGTIKTKTTGFDGVIEVLGALELSKLWHIAQIPKDHLETIDAQEESE